MKVAICVSGLLYQDSPKLIELLKARFPDYDLFMGTWESHRSDMSEGLGCMHFPEPEMHYHPYSDIVLEEPFERFDFIREKAARLKAEGKDWSWMDKALHQTKQILIHSHMLDSIADDYDMIIRARFDLYLYDPKIPFEKFIEESYVESKAVGFSKRLSNLGAKYWSAKNTHRHTWWDRFLMDLMICHPRSLFDKARMEMLHREKKLQAAEFGWYQVLSETHGSNHDCYFARMSMTSRDGYAKI